MSRQLSLLQRDMAGGGGGEQAPKLGGKWAAQRMFWDNSADEVDSAGSLGWTENTGCFLVGREEVRSSSSCVHLLVSSQPKTEVHQAGFQRPPSSDGRWRVSSESSCSLHPMSAC